MTENCPKFGEQGRGEAFQTLPKDLIVFGAKRSKNYHY